MFPAVFSHVILDLFQVLRKFCYSSQTSHMRDRWPWQCLVFIRFYSADLTVVSVSWPALSYGRRREFPEQTERDTC